MAGDKMEGLVTDGYAEVAEVADEQGGGLAAKPPQKRPRRIRRTKPEDGCSGRESYEQIYHRKQTDYQLARHLAAEHDPQLKKQLGREKIWVPLAHGLQ